MILAGKTGVAPEFYLLKTKLYIVTSCCKHKKGMLFCSFLVKTRLNIHIIFLIYVFCLCYFLVAASANNHGIFIDCVSGITVVKMIKGVP